MNTSVCALSLGALLLSHSLGCAAQAMSAGQVSEATFVEPSETAPISPINQTTNSAGTQLSSELSSSGSKAVDFAGAVSQMTEHSPKLAAAKAAVQSKQLQSDAAK